MIDKALDKLDLKSGTMSFIFSVVIAFFAFYEKDSTEKYSDQADRRLEDKIQAIHSEVSLLKQGSESVIINKTRIEQNSGDIQELKQEIRYGFDKLNKKLDEYLETTRASK